MLEERIVTQDLSARQSCLSKLLLAIDSRAKYPLSFLGGLNLKDNQLA